MAITLSVSTTTVTLSEDMLWADEFNWQPVEQKAQRTITGALVVSVAERQAGRPITLQSEDGFSGAIKRSALEQIQVWAAIPGQQMTLTLRGAFRTVIFRHEDAAIDSRPFVHFADIGDDDYYIVTFRFLEIE